MANNYVANGALSVLIGDGGLTQATPTSTIVNNDKVNACLETQSTTRADIFMKPKTDAQITAIPNPTPGMMAFNSTTGKGVIREPSGWATLNPISGYLYKKVVLTAAQVQGMSATPVEILPQEFLGNVYVVHAVKFTKVYIGALFTGGGVINLQYGNTPLGAGEDASNAIAATLLTSGASNQFAYATGNDSTIVNQTGVSNLTITNTTAPFAGGGSSLLIVDVWYSYVPLTT